MRIQANWRSLPLTGSCILKGHDDHEITCLQIRGDIIVTGSDDNSLKVWSASKAKVGFFFCSVSFWHLKIKIFEKDNLVFTYSCWAYGWRMVFTNVGMRKNYY